MWLLKDILYFSIYENVFLYLFKLTTKLYQSKTFHIVCKKHLVFCKQKFTILNDLMTYWNAYEAWVCVYMICQNNSPNNKMHLFDE